MNRPHLVVILAIWFVALPARALVGGVVDANSPDSPWAGVGSLILEGGGIFSGALIGPRHVLTAAHVVSGLRNSPDGITFQLNLGDGRSQSFEALAVHVDPEYQGTRAGPDGVWHHDLAVVELSRPVPAGVPIYDLFAGIPGAGPDPETRDLTLVSYGNTLAASGGELITGRPDVRRVGRNQVEALLWDQAGGSRPGLFMFNFASAGSPMAEGGNSFASLSDTPEAGYIGGDSGSPVFIRDAGSWKLAGVAAFAGRTSGYDPGSFGGGTLVGADLAWLEARIHSPPALPPASHRGRWELGLMLIPPAALAAYLLRRRRR
jgi:hypothetical protein